MTSPLSRISAGSFFSGYIFEYSSLGWPGTTVTGENSILSTRPSSIAAMRTLRAKGEAGEKVSFICVFLERVSPSSWPDLFRPSTLPRQGAKTWMPGHRRAEATPSFGRLCPGMTTLCDVQASRLDDLLALLAETFDAERDDVADIEELRRLHAGADAGRRARGDDVAGQQCHELRNIGNALRHRENHGRGRSGLTALPIDVEPHRQFLDVGDLVLRHEPGAERAERVMRLALGPLSLPLDLEIALGDVVADAVAGDMVERVGLGDIFGAGADDRGDFDFPVELGRAARLLDRIVRTRQRRVGLQKENRLGRDRVSSLLGMIDIVQADRDEFGDPGHGRSQARLASDGRERVRVEGGELLQRGRRIGVAVEVLDVGRQVAQLAGFVDQTGFFVTDRAVTNKLHVSLPSKVF